MQIILKKNKWNQIAELLSNVLLLKEQERQQKLEEERRDRGLKTQEYWVDRDRRNQTREEEQYQDAQRRKKAYEQSLSDYGQMPEYLNSPEMPAGLEALGIQGGSFVPEAFENEARKDKGMDIFRQQVAEDPSKFTPDKLEAGGRFWGMTGRGQRQRAEEDARKKKDEEDAKRKADEDSRIRVAIASRAPREPREPREEREPYADKILRESIEKTESDILELESELEDMNPDRSNYADNMKRKQSRIETLRAQLERKKKQYAARTGQTLPGAGDGEDVPEWFAQGLMNFPTGN